MQYILPLVLISALLYVYFTSTPYDTDRTDLNERMHEMNIGSGRHRHLQKLSVSIYDEYCTGVDHQWIHSHLYQSNPSDHHTVDNLPGYGQTEPMYTGYLPVTPCNRSVSNTGIDSKLYYWFIPKDATAESDTTDRTVPVVIWINGGPGCSSIMGAMTEIGKYQIDQNSNDHIKLKLNQFSWSRMAHILYIDQPIGVGYSFLTGKDSTDSIPHTHLMITEQFFYAIQSWYHAYPQYRKHPLYIAGESYAGKYIPWLAHYTLKYNHKLDHTNKHELHIPLAGVLLGNAMIAPEIQRFMFRPILTYTGFIDEYQSDKLERLEVWCRRDIEAHHYAAAKDSCQALEKYVTAVTGNVNMYDLRNFRSADYPKKQFLQWLNEESTRQSLHIDSHTKLENDCNDDVADAIQNINLDSAKALVTDLFTYSDIRILFYNGLFDITEGPYSESTFVNSIQWNGRDQLYLASRYAVHDQGDKRNDVVAYCKSYSNISLCTIASAGHMVPTNTPSGIYTVVNKFLSHEPLCTYKPNTDQCISTYEQICDYLHCMHGTCVARNGGECNCRSSYAGVDCSTYMVNLNDYTRHKTTKNQQLRYHKKYTIPVFESTLYYLQLTSELCATHSTKHAYLIIDAVDLSNQAELNVAITHVNINKHTNQHNQQSADQFSHALVRYANNQTNIVQSSNYNHQHTVIHRFELPHHRVSDTEYYMIKVSNGNLHRNADVQVDIKVTCGSVQTEL